MTSFMGSLLSSCRCEAVAVAEIAARRSLSLVLDLDRGEPITSGQAGCGSMAEDPESVAAEDRALDGAVGGAERAEAVTLLHVLRDLEPAQGLDLPLR